MGSIFVISINIPSTNPSLLNLSAASIAVSPFTLVFRDAGIAAAASVMNAAILIAVVSAGNTSIYASSRILFALAKNGQAPKVFAKTWRYNGVPLFAIALSISISFVTFFGAIFGQGVVFTWLYNLIAICNLLIYMSQCLVHLRFRKGWMVQGNDPNDLPYKAGWYPYTSIFAFLMGCLIVAGEGYVAATTRPFAWANIVATYIGIPTFFALYLIWNFVKKARPPPSSILIELTARYRQKWCLLKKWTSVQVDHTPPPTRKSTIWLCWSSGTIENGRTSTRRERLRKQRRRFGRSCFNYCFSFLLSERW